MFPSPHGDKFQPVIINALEPCACFRPLTGINFNIAAISSALATAFPSPHGDKFQPVVLRNSRLFRRFRPLTGINFNHVSGDALFVKDGFRPLTGINFNSARFRV